jgi:hypothetical protein
MALTFSIYDGTDKETVVYPINSFGIEPIDNSLLDLFKDNSDRFLTEGSIRTGVLSLVSSYPFKETGNYIGLDSLNPDYRDFYTVTTGSSSSWVKPKFYFGKRSYSGTYSYTSSQTFNIMNDTLLNSDSDIFFYNTKDDLSDNRRTRLRILSGTSLSNFSSHPFIQSQIIEAGQTDSVSLDFINQLGNVNVISDLGTVSINGVGIPTQTTLGSTPSDGKVLLFNNGYLEWGDITYPSTDNIGMTGTSTNILGDPVLVNGYSLELTDSRWIPVGINDVSIGTTFSGLPIAEVLKRIIYPYLPPDCSIRLLPPYDSGYVEVGTFPTPTLEFQINKKSNNTQITVLDRMIPGAYPPLVSNNYITATGTSTGIVISPIGPTSTEFTISVSDVLGGTSSDSTKITGIYPYFWGWSNLTTITNVGLGSLTKSVEPLGDKIVDLVGSGNFYFIYDKDYGTLSNIIGYGTQSGASFSISSRILSSPTGLWSGKEFWVYQWNVPNEVGPFSEFFEFRY